MSQGDCVAMEEILDRNFIKVTPDITIYEGRLLCTRKDSVLVVLKDNQLVGVVPGKMIFGSNIEAHKDIGSLMRRDFIVVDKDIASEDILAYFEESNSPLVVVDRKNRIIGVICFEALLFKLALLFNIARSRLNTVLNTVDEAICIIDDEDAVTHWNHRAEILYNIKAEKIVGNNIEEYFSNLMVTKVIKERGGVSSVYHQPCKDTHVLISANPVKIGSKIVGGVSAERNITEVVQLNEKLNDASSQVQELQSRINLITGRNNPFAYIRGHHQKLTQLINMAKKVAVTNATVLIIGESGTGKELFARAIHEASKRSDKPFIVVNCAAIPVNLFESEVFGYEGGSFTGANRQGKAGFFENANGGTLFLDEVAELSPGLQVKLLRVLQDNILYRVGGSKPVKIDVRIIAATNRNLEEMLVNGHFREDLYYRLNVITLNVPPLRERREDIPELVHQFAQGYSQLYGRRIARIKPEVMAVLMAYPWPGNVRELKNVIERMVILSDSEVISKEHIPDALQQHGKLADKAGLASVTEQTERELIIRTLKQTNGNRSQTARMLGIPRSTLYYKMSQLGLK